MTANVTNCIILPTVMNDSSCLNFELLNGGVRKFSSSQTKLLTQTLDFISRENEFHLDAMCKIIVNLNATASPPTECWWHFSDVDARKVVIHVTL